MNFWFYFFAVLAFLAWVGVFRAARKGLATQMTYSLLMAAVWVALALWFGDYINGR